MGKGKQGEVQEGGGKEDIGKEEDREEDNGEHRECHRSQRSRRDKRS